MKGHLARIKYKKFKFLHLLTGKKPFQIEEDDNKDLKRIPQSNVRVVLLKEI
jgi:hypothetical protein